MYTPKAFEESQSEVLHHFIRAHPFGIFVTNSETGPKADHLPVLLDTSGQTAVLNLHVARANAVWKTPPDAQEVLVIFHGPHAYVSPSWYPSKTEHGKVVPTWNYAVVHAYGTARIIDDAAWTRRHLAMMVQTHEAGRENPWKLTDAPADYIEQMLHGVVGVEITVTRLVGKLKLSQNRSLADREGVILGLTKESESNAHAIAELMGATLRPEGT